MWHSSLFELQAGLAVNYGCMGVGSIFFMGWGTGQGGLETGLPGKKMTSLALLLSWVSQLKWSKTPFPACICTTLTNSCEHKLVSQSSDLTCETVALELCAHRLLH